MWEEAFRLDTRPMIAVEPEEEARPLQPTLDHDAGYIFDDTYCAHPYYINIREVFRIFASEDVIVSGRLLQERTDHVLRYLAEEQGDYIVDAVMSNTGKIIIVDTLQLQGDDVTHESYILRYSYSRQIYDYVGGLTSENDMVVDSPLFDYLPIARTTEEKQVMYNSLKNDGTMGIVFRSMYTSYKNTHAVYNDFSEETVFIPTGVREGQVVEVVREQDPRSTGSVVVPAFVWRDLCTRIDNREFMTVPDLVIRYTGVNTTGTIQNPVFVRVSE